MHKIINFILLFLILTFGNILAPEHILTDGWKTTLLVTVICFITEAILSAISSIIFIGGYVASSLKVNLPMFILSFVFYIGISIVLPVLALKVCEHFIPAFAVNGILTYIVLMFSINLLSVSDSKSQKGNTNK